MGGGLFRHPFFTQCCRESFWENRGAEVVGFWWSCFGDMVPRGLRLGPSAGKFTSCIPPPAPRRILTGRGPEAGQSSKVGGVNFPDHPPSLINSISLVPGRCYAAHCQWVKRARRAYAARRRHAAAYAAQSASRMGLLEGLSGSMWSDFPKNFPGRGVNFGHDLSTLTARLRTESLQS